jgi:hypothetical protein
MKKILCLIATVLVLLPLVLSAQDFNPAKGPLEGVWENETDNEDVIIFVGNLVLEPDFGSTYDVTPVIYQDGKILEPDEPGSKQTGYHTVCNYKLSGNTLRLIRDDYVEVYVRSGDDILQNKSPLEGVWSASYPVPDYPESASITWIFTGGLMILSMQADFFSQYGAAQFSYSDEAIYLPGGGPTTFYTISGNTLTLFDNDESDPIVLTKK